MQKFIKQLQADIQPEDLILEVATEYNPTTFHFKFGWLEIHTDKYVLHYNNRSYAVNEDFYIELVKKFKKVNKIEPQDENNYENVRWAGQNFIVNGNWEKEALHVISYKQEYGDKYLQLYIQGEIQNIGIEIGDTIVVRFTSENGESVLKNLQVQHINVVEAAYKISNKEMFIIIDLFADIIPDEQN